MYAGMKALVVDDDLVLADGVGRLLKLSGFDVALAHDGKTALDVFASLRPDIVILDVQIPEPDGFVVCRAIREQANTPIIMLTVRDTDADIVAGLGFGADDYMTKPFSSAQLLARVQAVLRRAAPTASNQLVLNNCTLDTERNTLTLPDRPSIQLTPLEVRMLESLMTKPGQVVKTQALIDLVYGPGGGDKAMLKQLVYRLRRKVEGDDGHAPLVIEAVPGVGYAVVAPA